MKQLFCHKSIYIRFASLYTLGILLFLVAWFLSYLILPEGILRGKNIATQLAGSDVENSLLKELIKIFVINLFSSSLIIYANFDSKVKGYPLGYLIPLLWLVHYGLLLGSNSFSVPMSQRMSPSFEVLQRSGLYEIAAYTLIAVSTYTLPRYEMKGFFTSERKLIPPSSRAAMTKEQWIGIGIAIIVLFLSNLREAYKLMAS